MSSNFPGSEKGNTLTDRPSRLKWSHLLATGCATLLGVTGTSCAAAEQETSPTSEPAQLCAIANDYVWYVNRASGAYGSPPSPERSEQVLSTVIDLADTLIHEVPEGRQKQAKVARKTWRAGDRVFAKYDYGRGGGMPPQASTEMEEALAPYSGSNRKYVKWLTDECAPDDGEWPTPPPEQ